MDYWVGGGQRVCWPPPSKLLGGGGGGAGSPGPLFLRLCDLRVFSSAFNKLRNTEASSSCKYKKRIKKQHIA